MSESGIRDLNKCPVCQTTLVFVKGMKPTGHIGIMAFHEGDQLPEGAEILYEVKNSYKKHCADRDCGRMHASTEHVVTVNESIVGNDQAPEEGPDNNKTVENMALVVSIPIKEKVVIPARTGNPELSKDRPIVDITDMKHNRFAIVGHIVKMLRDSGKYSDRINSIRSDLVNNSHDMPELFRTAEQYAIIHENGLPVHMESGL